MIRLNSTLQFYPKDDSYLDEDMDLLTWIMDVEDKYDELLERLLTESDEFMDLCEQNGVEINSEEAKDIAENILKDSGIDEEINEAEQELKDDFKAKLPDALDSIAKSSAEELLKFENLNLDGLYMFGCQSNQINVSFVTKEYLDDATIDKIEEKLEEILTNKIVDEKQLTNLIDEPNHLRLVSLDKYLGEIDIRLSPSNKISNKFSTVFNVDEITSELD